MNRDLFLSLLALDSYNREYAAGIYVDSSGIGTAIITDRVSLGDFTRHIL